MGLTQDEIDFLSKLQQPRAEETFSDIQYTFEDKLINIKSSVDEAKKQLLSVQDHLNALEDASKNLKEKYLQHQHTFIELNNVLNWFDVIDELIVILRSGTPVLSAINRNFDKMYKDVDDCHSYLLKHPDYKLSKEYLPTARVVISKALALYSLAFTESVNQISTDIKSIPNAQANLEGSLDQLVIYTAPLCAKSEDVEFRQLLEDCVENFVGHRGQSIRPLFTNVTLDQGSVLGCVESFIKLMKSFLFHESALFVRLFQFNYISYNQLYSNLIQAATKHVVEYIAPQDPDILLEIRLLLNSELIASELDNKSKLVLLEGVSDLSNFLNKS